MNILVIGGGGREHAIVWKLKQSPKVGKMYCIPGNAGISTIAECFMADVMDFPTILEFLKNHKDIGLTVVAPDNPLAGGLVDYLEAAGHRVFGPSKAAALIESSKSFSKDLMKRYKIPTARYEVFDDIEKAKKYIADASFPIVIKADGLALGKGVIIAQNKQEADKALEDMMVGGAFGESGREVVIEEFLTGFEVSVLAFTDGKTVVPMVSSQDHKRALNGDKGLNTGGMGAFSPSQKYNNKMAEFAYDNIFEPTIKAMEQEGRTFKGVIYFGLMIDDSKKNADIRVLEYNARFGDPETQAVLPRLKSDLVDIFEAIIDERLHEIEIKWTEEPSVCLVLASGGYPEKYETGKKILFGELERDIIVFHAGTKIERDTLVTAGGRVLGVTALGKTLKDARDKVYNAAKKIKFEKVHYRTDILK